MTRLKAALMCGIVLVMAGAGDAQAANMHFPLWNFGLIDGLGDAPTLVLHADVRIPAIDLSDDQDGSGKPPVKPSGPDWKTQYEENTTNGDNWSSNQVDEPDGEWHQTTVSQDPPQWTTQTATRP